MADEPCLPPCPVAPTPPDDAACCGNGCEQCVWTVYQAELNAYRLALTLWQQAAADREQQSGERSYG